jgi:hypothetical protein
MSITMKLAVKYVCGEITAEEVKSILDKLHDPELAFVSFWSYVEKYGGNSVPQKGE